MSIIHHKDGGTTITGNDSINVYRAIVLASGLRLYAKTGMKPNRAYTPTAMLRAASVITGKNYKRNQYLVAADDLSQWAQRTRKEKQLDIQQG